MGLLPLGRCKVVGDSMSPTLVDGQYVLMTRGPAANRRPRRGDIVVLRHPMSHHTIFVKRIIGLPEEDIRLEDGRVRVGGSLLEEVYLEGPWAPGEGQVREWWTGPDEYFLMGDNRGDSQDSRAFGPVSRKQIIGRVWFRYWPPRAWGPVSISRGSRR